jgi:flagellar basal-body rod modification protein FlgD
MSVNSTQSIAENRERFAKYFTQKEKDAFSMENFFTLLMAEMSNQDPLEPMSNTEFISQLANFTGMKAQQDALYYQNANYAQSLVGKTVTVAAMAGSKFEVESGIVTSMSLSGGDFMVKVNGKDYPLSRIMEVLPTQNPFTVTGDNGAYATSLIGKHVTVVGRNESGTRVIENGIVLRIEIADNEINLIMNVKDEELAYPLDSVIKVENPTTAQLQGQSSTLASDLTAATALIGKRVTFVELAENGDVNYTDTGIVTHVETRNNQVMLMMDGLPYSLSQITKVQDA